MAAGSSADWRHLAALLLATVLLVLGAHRLAQHPELLNRPLALVNRLRRRPAEHGHDRLRGFLTQLRTARLRPALGLAAAVLALANWLLDAVGLWLCFRAIGEPPPSLIATLLAFCAAMAAGSVTIVPGGFGVIDSALILGLITGGVPASTAVAVTVLYRIRSFGFIIGLGWLSWLRLRRQPAPEQPEMPAPAAPVTGFSHRPGRPRSGQRGSRSFRTGRPGTSRPATRRHHPIPR
jgi:uncharacterized protein (TIRG00374 family)